MALITTRNKPKSFSWSYSKIKNYETCPKRHFHCDIAKDVKEEESEQLAWGNEVHKHLALRIAKGEKLPAGMQAYDKWCTPILTSTGNILVEQKLAITKDFGPCSWFSDEAWFRGIGDVIKIVGPVALIADWKTGKIIEDSAQLALMAACVFAHYPEVVKVRSEFIWLKEDATTRQDFHRNNMPAFWATMLPRVKILQEASEKQIYPAKPSHLCRKWCPVSSCPHHGE